VLAIVNETPLPIPNRPFYGWLGLGFLAFVVYGSWVPFNVASLPLEQAVEQFQNVLAGPVRIDSRSDWVANILLMLPAAFCLMGALGADRPKAGWLGDIVLVLPACLCVSVLVEFGQLFLPGRVSSLNDIVAQGVGAVLGAGLWGLFGQALTLWGRGFWQGRDASAVEVRILPVYLVMLLVRYLLPLDLTISPSEIYRKFKYGRASLVPFHFLPNAPYAFIEKNIQNVIYFVVLGFLLVGLTGSRWRAGRRAVWVLGCGILFVGLLNGMKLLVASRVFDITDVVVESLAMVAGWWLRLSFRDRASHRLTGPPMPAWRVCFLGIWLALLAFATWRPFDFDLDLARPRLEGLSLLPFADLQLGQEVLALQNVGEKMMLYLPLGMLLTTWKPHAGRLFWLPTLLAGFLVALTLEAGQLVLVSRTASLSDVYVETAAAVVGSWLARRMCAPSKGAGQDLCILPPVNGR
jgi:VanZ family protein